MIKFAREFVFELPGKDGVIKAKTIKNNTDISLINWQYTRSGDHEYDRFVADSLEVIAARIRHDILEEEKFRQS